MTIPKVAVIDYGMGNLRSVSQAVRQVAGSGWDVIVTSNADVVRDADRVVFPGQGAMPDCMRELESRGLRDVVVEATRNKPFLGICIGLQMLFEASEETCGRSDVNSVPGLGVLAGEVRRFPEDCLVQADGSRLKVPHMGWNRVVPVDSLTSHALWRGLPVGERFYFVHSYYVAPAEASIEAAHCDYGITFTAAVARDNVFAVQFHPEKSAGAGLTLLSNFLAWKP